MVKYYSSLKAQLEAEKAQRDRNKKDSDYDPMADTDYINQTSCESLLSYSTPPKTPKLKKS